MPALPSCPDLPALERLLLGQTPDPEAEALEIHVSGCARCTAALSRARAVDPLVEAIRPRKPLVSEADRELVRGLIGRLKVLNPFAAARIDEVPTVDLRSAVPGVDTPPPPQHAAGPAEKTQEVCRFLAPPEQEGELGRLGGYRVVKVLGTGGMGVVFLAEDVQLRRRVALKAMLPALADSPGTRERFLQEARAIAAVRNDHVVIIYQVGEERGVPFLAMELLDG
jgi:eukaryotic-like serine/threonine-protein kinase